MSSEERIDLLHEVIEMLPPDRRYLEEMRNCCRRALPDATDREIRCAMGRSLVVLGWQLGLTHIRSDEGRAIPLAEGAERYFGGKEQADRAFGTLKGMTNDR
jgi:hypothetical protein